MNDIFGRPYTHRLGCTAEDSARSPLIEEQICSDPACRLFNDLRNWFGYLPDELDDGIFFEHLVPLLEGSPCDSSAAGDHGRGAGSSTGPRPAGGTTSKPLGGPSSSYLREYGEVVFTEHLDKYFSTDSLAHTKWFSRLSSRETIASFCSANLLLARHVSGQVKIAGGGGSGRTIEVENGTSDHSSRDVPPSPRHGRGAARTGGNVVGDVWRDGADAEVRRGASGRAEEGVPRNEEGIDLADGVVAVAAGVQIVGGLASSLVTQLRTAIGGDDENLNNPSAGREEEEKFEVLRDKSTGMTVLGKKRPVAVPKDDTTAQPPKLQLALARGRLDGPSAAPAPPPDHDPHDDDDKPSSQGALVDAFYRLLGWCAYYSVHGMDRKVADLSEFRSRWSSCNVGTRKKEPGTVESEKQVRYSILRMIRVPYFFEIVDIPLGRKSVALKGYRQDALGCVNLP